MSVILKPGLRLFDVTSAGEFIVVRAPAESVNLTIGGQPAQLTPADRDAVAPPLGDAVVAALLGKRYRDDSETVELLCVRRGANLPAVDGRELHEAQVKPLPASD